MVLVWVVDVAVLIVLGFQTAEARRVAIVAQHLGITRGGVIRVIPVLYYPILVGHCHSLLLIYDKYDQPARGVESFFTVYHYSSLMGRDSESDYCKYNFLNFVTYLLTMPL